MQWPRRCLMGIMVLLLGFVLARPAEAASVDPYITQYLQVKDAVPLVMDTEGHQQSFSAGDLITGKQLFSENCKSCHVGGATLPNPLVSLSLQDLSGATPPP